MVLAPQSLEDSPLALLRLARSEADLELRKSLAKASMLALTLCVSVLFARALLFTPAPLRMLEIPIVDLPSNRVMKPPVPLGNPAAPPPTAVDARGEIIPVDQPVPTEPEKLVAPNPGVDTGPVTQGNPGDGGQVHGSGVPARPVEPGPKDFVFYEVLPQAVRTVKPDYPPIAQQAGMEGKVMVRMLIDVDGTVRRAEIETSSAMFDEDALKAARQWRFSPAMSDGKPVMAWVRVPFDFRLH